MTRNELVTHLIAADYFRGQWTLNDREYSPFSVAFVRSAHAEWVKSLPDELTFQRDLGGGKTVRAVAWIPEAWNCNNIARDFGAFAEILPGQEGMIHISQLANERVAMVTDVVKVGDIVPLKVISIDEQGRINLSLKEARK